MNPLTRTVPLAALVVSVVLVTSSWASAATPAGESGLAAVYSTKLQGRKTASGERYDRNQLTTAHPSLPFGTRVKVTRADNGKSVILRVNDRGPREPGRIVDISSAAARRIGLGAHRMTEVRVEVVGAAPNASTKHVAVAKHHQAP